MFSPIYFYESGKIRFPFANRLTGYYSLNNNYDDSIAPFASLYFGGVTGFSFINGKYSKALYRDNTMGAGTRYSPENVSKYSFTDGINDVPYSFSVWLYVIGTGSSYGVILGKNAIGLGNQNTNAEYVLSVSRTNKIYFQKWSEGSTANWSRFTTVDSIPLNQWVHLGVSDDALGNVRIYFNGTEKTTNKTNQGTGFIKYSSTSGVFEIFSSPAANSITYLYGAMDDLGIFRNTVLTQQEFSIITIQNKSLRW